MIHCTLETLFLLYGMFISNLKERCCSRARILLDEELFTVVRVVDSRHDYVATVNRIA